MTGLAEDGYRARMADYAERTRDIYVVDDLADDELLARLEATGMTHSSAVAMVEHRDEADNARWIAEYLRREAA